MVCSCHFVTASSTRHAYGNGILGPIFKLSIAGAERLIVSSYELCNELCDEKRFSKVVAGPLLQVRNGTGDGLFTAFQDEENWGLAHRILMPAFGPLAICNMFDGAARSGNVPSTQSGMADMTSRDA